MQVNPEGGTKTKPETPNSINTVVNRIASVILSLLVGSWPYLRILECISTFVFVLACGLL